MTIKAGDLVMVTRPTICCGSAYGIGMVFTAGDIKEGIGLCMHCGKNQVGAATSIPNSTNRCATYRLTKIDPPAAQSEETQTKELQTT